MVAPPLLSPGFLKYTQRRTASPLFAPGRQRGSNTFLKKVYPVIGESARGAVFEGEAVVSDDSHTDHKVTDAMQEAAAKARGGIQTHEVAGVSCHPDCHRFCQQLNVSKREQERTEVLT